MVTKAVLFYFLVLLAGAVCVTLSASPSNTYENVVESIVTAAKAAARAHNEGDVSAAADAEARCEAAFREAVGMNDHDPQPFLYFAVSRS